MKLVYEPFEDGVHIKNYFELEKWDVINTAYGCPSNKGLWAMYQKRVECDYNNHWHIDLRCFSVYEKRVYTPLANYGSTIYDVLSWGDEYKTEAKVLCELIDNWHSSIDVNVGRPTFRVTGRMVEVNEE